MTVLSRALAVLVVASALLGARADAQPTARKPRALRLAEQVVLVERRAPSIEVEIRRAEPTISRLQQRASFVHEIVRSTFTEGLR